MAVHSQDVSMPDCPTGYQTLWNGYSFLMVGVVVFVVVVAVVALAE